jgi:hypothetical protein
MPRCPHTPPQLVTAQPKDVQECPAISMLANMQMQIDKLANRVIELEKVTKKE